MQINQIDAFLAIAELESFSLAAERLHITQPAVSKRIGQLENLVRVRLFDRIGKRSILTPNGRAFKPHAERILQELKSFSSGLSQQQATPSGSLADGGSCGRFKTVSSALPAVRAAGSPVGPQATNRLVRQPRTISSSGYLF